MEQLLSAAIAGEALDRAPIGILILDKAGRVVWLNRALEELLSIESNQLVGQSAATAAPELHKLVFAPEPTMPLEAVGGRVERRLQIRRAQTSDGGALHYYTDITDLQNVRDERARLSEELAQHTTRDPLTGLPNRQALLQGLEPLVSRSRRYHNPLSVIRLRIDNLPDIEAEHGTGAGDAALTAVSQMLKDQTRWADLIGRFDQDEFLLILPETNLDSAAQLLDKLRRRLAGLGLNSSGGRPLALSARLGAAGWHLGDDRAKLLRRARDMLEQDTTR